jgi:hypothetical protein
MMSRLHGRRDWHGLLVDWMIDCTAPGSFSASSVPVMTDCKLTLRGLDHDTAVRIAAVVECTVSYLTHSLGFSLGFNSGYLELSRIHLADAEAQGIAHGMHPLDVLLHREELWPECGYRLVAVPDPLTGGA